MTRHVFGPHPGGVAAITGALARRTGHRPLPGGHRGGAQLVLHRVGLALGARRTPAHHWGWPRLHVHLALPLGLVHRITAPGPLESPLLAAVLGVCALGGVGGWWWLHRRSRGGGRRRLRWAGRGVAAIAVVFALLAGAVGVNGYVGYLPTVTATRDLLSGTTPSATQSIPTGLSNSRAGSSVVVLRLPTPQLGMPNGNAYVYLPPGYQPSHRYPVLYLLGGAPGNGTAWWLSGNLQKTADALIAGHLMTPMLIVVPRLNPNPFVDYEVLNSPNGPQIMTYLMTVVKPAVESHFATVPDRTARAIAGFSAGADGALNTGLKHLGQFGAIGSIEPEGWPGHAAWWVVHHNHALMWANSPIRYIPTMRFTRRVDVYLSGNGNGDAAVNTLAAQLRARGQLVTVHNEFGMGHTWRDARADLPYLLRFVSEFFTAAARTAA